MKGFVLSARVLVFLDLLACFTLSARTAPSVLSFDVTQQLKPGQTTKDQVLRILGEPREIMDPKKLKNVKDVEKFSETWEFGEGEHSRLSLYFPQGGTLLESWTWHVRMREPEQKLKKAMNLFSNASWEASTDRWINPHSFPNDCYFESKTNGVTISYNRARNEVFTISRRDPNRQPTSEETEPAPEFCIDNSCSKGIPSADFFKEKPISDYCKIPQ